MGGTAKDRGTQRGDVMLNIKNSFFHLVGTVKYYLPTTTPPEKNASGRKTLQWYHAPDLMGNAPEMMSVDAAMERAKCRKKHSRRYLKRNLKDLLGIKNITTLMYQSNLNVSKHLISNAVMVRPRAVSRTTKASI